MTTRPRRPLRRTELRESFYASALSEAERVAFAQAREIDGLAEESAVLRVRLREALAEHPEDATLIEHGVQLLIRSLLAHQRLTPQQADGLTGSLANILEEFGRVMRGGDLDA